MKLGRNDPCHCGSGLKYKKCHAAKDDEARSAELAAQAAARAAAAAEAASSEEGDAEGDAEKAVATGGAQQRPALNRPDRLKRPKLPTAHSSNLPRRGAV